MADDRAAEVTSAIIFDLKTLTQFDATLPKATILADTGAAQVVLLGMRAGQQVDDVLTTSQLIVQCLRGRVTLRMGQGTQELRAGLVALIEAETPHGFSARTDCVILLTLTPSPERDAAHRLLQGLIPLVQRQ